MRLPPGSRLPDHTPRPGAIFSGGSSPDHPHPAHQWHRRLEPAPGPEPLIQPAPGGLGELLFSSSRAARLWPRPWTWRPAVRFPLFSEWRRYSLNFPRSAPDRPDRMVPQASLTGTDPGNAGATNRLREEVSGSAWSWDLKLREDTVSRGAYRTPED